MGIDIDSVQAFQDRLDRGGCLSDRLTKALLGEVEGVTLMGIRTTADEVGFVACSEVDCAATCGVVVSGDTVQFDGSQLRDIGESCALRQDLKGLIHGLKD